MKKNILVSFLSLFAAAAIMVVLYFPYYFIVTITNINGFDDGSFGLYIIISSFMLPIIFFISGRIFLEPADSKKQNFITFIILGIFLSLIWLVVNISFYSEMDSPLVLFGFAVKSVACFIPSLFLWLGMKSQIWVNILDRKVIRIPLLILTILFVAIILCKAGYVYFKTTQTTQIEIAIQKITI